MEKNRKEEFIYFSIFVIGIIHMFIIFVYNIVQTEGQLRLEMETSILLGVSLIVASLGLILYTLRRKGFSFFLRLGLIEPATQVAGKGELRCSRCMAKISKTATRCPECEAKFKYDSEEIGYFTIVVMGMVMIYITIINDLLLNRNEITIEPYEIWIIILGSIITTAGLIPFMFKRAGFSFADTVSSRSRVSRRLSLSVDGIGGPGGISIAGMPGVAAAPQVAPGMPPSPGIQSGYGGGPQIEDLEKEKRNIEEERRRLMSEISKREDSMRKQLELETKMNEMERRRELERELDREKDQLRGKVEELRSQEMRMREKLQHAESKEKEVEIKLVAIRETEDKKMLTKQLTKKEKTKTKRALFPFTAIVGQEMMKRALVLNAVNHTIGGVLIRGQKGTGKSTGVRGLVEILPDIEIVKECRFSCDPKTPEKFCWECEDRYKKGEIETEFRAIKVVDLPLNVTEDRLVGSIDLEKVLSEGLKAFEPGILAEAHRGILYVDEINLLDDYVVDVLLDSAAMGINTVERESVSVSHPAQFIIVGSMNPEEGELRPQLLDRIALQVELVGIPDVKKRIEIIEARKEFTRDPEGFKKKYDHLQKQYKDRIVRARELLPSVNVPRKLLDIIAKICIEFNVDGHRADIIIENAARTNAAYEGRDAVSTDDLVAAAEMVLPHRMRKRPFEEEVFSSELLKELVRKYE